MTSPGRNPAIIAREKGIPFVVSAETRAKQSANNGMHKRRHTDEFKQKQRERAIARGFGGVRQSRWIRYKGHVLGSSYELEVCKSLDEHNIKWTTCKRFFYIDPKGKSRSYTPDIYLVDYDLYLDPKNDYLINNPNPKLGFFDHEKIKRVMEQNNIRVIILDKTQLQWPIISQLITNL